MLVVSRVVTRIARVRTERHGWNEKWGTEVAGTPSIAAPRPSYAVASRRAAGNSIPSGNPRLARRLILLQIVKEHTRRLGRC